MLVPEHIGIVTDGSGWMAARVAETAGDAGVKHLSLFTPDGIKVLNCPTQSTRVEAGLPPLDLLICTGGERKLTDLLLWHAAYAEFVFTEKRWPAFGESDLREVLRVFASRARMFLAIPGTSYLCPGARLLN